MTEELKYSELLRKNRELAEELAAVPPYRIAVLSNIVVHQLKELLEFTLRCEGINAQVELGDYDNIVQDSARFADRDAVLLFREACNLVDGLQYKADLMAAAELEALIDYGKRELDLICANLKGTSLVAINSFSNLLFNHALIGLNSFDRLAAVLNAHLQEAAPGRVIVDIDKVIATVSVERSANWRFYYSSKALYTVEFLREYARFVKPLFLAPNGRGKKALIFDCDNTLWGGVVGEDGPDGIKISSADSAGAVYQEVQGIAVELARRGVIIGLCSKNNSQDVEEILEHHPDMTLRNEHLAIKKVNWGDKLKNLLSVPAELNIGSDSIVFVDDSEFEINLIRQHMPEVALLQVPKEQYRYPAQLRRQLGLFFSHSATAEDGDKARMYRENALRESARSSYADLSDYLRGLRLKVAVHLNSEALVPRMAQLTQKTNQFNLTTRRYSEAEIMGCLAGGRHRLYAFSVSDRFGENGVTALLILELAGERAVIDTFLMSCRVIGRNIEYALLDHLVQDLAPLGVKTIEGSYLATRKNAQVAGLYDRFGFSLVETQGEEKLYRLELGSYQASTIDYVEVSNGA